MTEPARDIPAEATEDFVQAQEQLEGDLLKRARAKRRAQVEASRKSAAAFVPYAIRHEKTGKRITNAPHHEEWQAHFDQNRRAILFAPVEHGKTQQIGVGRAVHVLGQDPSRRGAIVSNTQSQASKQLQAIRSHIESNPRVHEVFPHLRRSSRPGDPWHQTAITVERPTIAKDPSLQAVGVNGPIVGSRLDFIILDDVLDFENTRTIEQRQKLVDWFDSTVLTRLTEDGVIWVVGTPWHPEDLMHVLAARPGWAVKRYSAIPNPDDDPAQWGSLWPAVFSNARLRDIYQSTTPYNFARKYLCLVRQDATARFQQAWLDAMIAAGKGWSPFAKAPTTGGKAWPCFTGVDLGVGEKEEHGLSCLFTIAIQPGSRKRVVVDVQSGRWQAPEIISRIMDVHVRFGSIVVVESNGAQKFLVQFASSGGLPVRPYFTNASNKYDEHFGVESLAVEMRNGLWIAPSGLTGGDPGDEVRAWHREMLYYNPESHTGDRLMASWFAREAARNYGGNIFGFADTQAR